MDDGRELGALCFEALREFVAFIGLFCVEGARFFQEERLSFSVSMRKEENMRSDKTYASPLFLHGITCRSFAARRAVLCLSLLTAMACGSSSSSDTPPEEDSAVCGNGLIEAGEACDDGKNDGSYGSCAPDCSARAAHCGDGAVNGDEECDDGLAGNSDTAPNACRTTCERAHCGDGVLDQAETCDGGDNCTEACTIKWTDATQAVTWEVKLDANSPTWKRNAVELCDSSVINANGSPYAVYSITNETGGDQTIAIAGSHTCLSTLHLYRGDFDPAQPSSNCELSTQGQFAEKVGLDRPGATRTELVSEFEQELFYLYSQRPVRNTIASGFEIKQGETVSVVVSTQFAEACAGSMKFVRAGCGNGIVEVNYLPILTPEVCAQTPELCEQQEQCDDGNTVDGDGCSSTCEIEEGVHCYLDSACQSACTQPACGNGIVEVGEACDDGNAADGDGCSSACEIEEGFLCVAEVVFACADLEKAYVPVFPSMSRLSSRCLEAGCGNGIVEVGEACDDGNAAAGDGCSSACEIEEGFTCNPTIPALYAEDDHTLVIPELDKAHLTSTCAPTASGPVCGNGIGEGDEMCDDGNAVGGDGCSSTCEIEETYVCALSSQVALLPMSIWQIGNQRAFSNCRIPACGDGILDEGEACDDGNTVDGDGCSAACEIESDWACERASHPEAYSIVNEDLVEMVFQISVDEGGSELLATSQCHPIVCGDGILDEGEACDDGNQAAGDGCSSACALETGFACPIAGAACVPIVCGDGVIEGPGACEDGNTADGDGCSSTCEIEDSRTLVIQENTSALKYGVSLDGQSPTWHRFNNSGDYYYDATRITNALDTSVAVDVEALWTCDGYLYAYTDPFDPSNPSKAPLKYSDDESVEGSSQSVLGSAFDLTLEPGATVVIVSTTYGANQTCLGTLTIALEDSDGDGVADRWDECPSDAAKTEVGICGCGVVESTADSDGDGTPDCIDSCPLDPNKTAPGRCGCGQSEVGEGEMCVEADSDGDGVLDNLDGCPRDPAKSAMSDAASCSDDGLLTIGMTTGELAAQANRTTTSAVQTLHYVPGGNLLRNPWRLENDDAWRIETNGAAGWERNWERARLLGNAPVLVGSYEDTVMSQTVNLSALREVLEAQVPLRLGALAQSRGNKEDLIQVKVEWLDDRAVSLGSKVLFDSSPPIEDGFDFRGALAEVDCPEGVSALSISFLTKDGEDWSGHYAAGFQGMQVMVGTPLVRFSNDGINWSPWEEAGWKKEGWQLSEGLGAKTVYMQSYNPATNRYDVVVDTIEVVAASE